MSKLDKLSSMIPLDDIEQAALKQIYDALGLPFLIKLAIMADCHCGYDLPIGGVALLDGMVSPSYCGYDLGCGMCLVRTGRSFRDLFHGDRHDPQVRELNVRPVYRRLYEAIPVGLGSNLASRQSYKPFKFSFNLSLADGKVDAKQKEKEINDRLGFQIGTLGGGNHFLELGVSEQTGEVCVTIHSGSRGPGWKSADVYMKLGRFFALDSELGQAYLKDLGFFLEYALENRRRMMVETFKVLGIDERHQKQMLATMINENHNHAVVRPDGVLHRKGATPADLGQLGVIPISMGAGVYVTRGLGNEEYLSSASHGAGRLMGRGRAKRELSIESFRADMGDILAPISEATLDESPRAYKGEDYVISAQKGIVVDIVDVIRPFAVVKGGKEGEDDEPQKT